MLYCGEALEDLAHCLEAQVLTEEASFLEVSFCSVPHASALTVLKVFVQLEMYHIRAIPGLGFDAIHMACTHRTTLLWKLLFARLNHLVL